MNYPVNKKIDNRCLFIILTIIYLFSFKYTSITIQAAVLLPKADNIDLSNNAMTDMHLDAIVYRWIGSDRRLNLYIGKNASVYPFEPDCKNTLCANLINKISKTTCPIVSYWLLVLAISICLGYWLYKRIVRKQQHVARRISEDQREQLYEAKLNFFANLTHELCTPLTLINAVNDYFTTYSTAVSDSRLKKYTLILRENVVSLNELIREILDFRKMEENETANLHIKKMQVSDLTARLLESFTPVAEQNNIQFVSSVPDRLFWNTDAISLKKIVLNLLSNAFKYTEEGGLIRVSVSSEAKDLFLKVYNTGRGICKKDIHSVFDRFRILEEPDGNSYTPMTSRNGLGLYICYSLVHALHGDIEVKSEEGKFAEFIVRLPLLPVDEPVPADLPENVIPVLTNEPDNEPVQQSLAEGPDNKPAILVVDDNKDLVWLIKETLSSGYTIREAYSAEEALSLMEQQTPALIITDILMPEMNGLELIASIKRDKFTRCIPLIIISAKISEKEQAEGWNVGADAYLTKPFSPVVLRSVVSRLMESRKELKEYLYSPESAYEQSGGRLTHQEDKEFMDSVVTIIRENIEKDTLRPELIAEKLNMTSRTLYRRFKKISSLTPSDYIKDYRLTYAAQLLVTTSLSVQEIIFQVGISNKSYFYREFSSKYQMTPWQYRQVKDTIPICKE